MTFRSQVAMSFFAAALMLSFSGKATAQQIRVPLAGTTSVRDLPTGGDAVTNDEFQFDQGDADDNGDDRPDLGVNRTIAKHNGAARSAHGNLRTKSNPEVVQTMQGLNFFDQRFANGGNQFSVEPPDQALCVGNGYVVEATNDVFKVLTTAGVPVVARMDLNTFYGYPAAINRTTGARGPSITDPVCYFDHDTRQFYMVVLTFDTLVATGANTGRNHLDIAVTTNGDPSGTWNIYRVASQNDGTEGTPNHGCGRVAAPPVTQTNPNACFPDYPHIGADAYGVYVSANEFPLFVGGFQGAEIYAFSKRALGRGDPSVTVNLLDTLGYGPDGGGFTVWPAQSPAGQYALQNNGTEYFMSSRAVFSDDGTSTSMLTWAITNTASLDTATPSLNLLVGDTSVLGYAIFQRATQKLGSTPLGQCTTVPSCAALVGARLQPSYTESKLNANDSRIQQVSYANGKLWGALDTGLLIDGDPTPRAGIAYYILIPQLNGATLKAKVANQGYIGAPFIEVGYPTIAALSNGRGIISYTLSGPNDFPSVAYSSLDPVAGAGPIHVAMAGAGPQDGFSGYLAAFGSTRPRWGDYGAAAVDGNTIWFAQEYVAQTCTFTEYLAAPLGQCGGTRGALGNYATGIVQVKFGK
jgi:hypothetical protein